MSHTTITVLHRALPVSARALRGALCFALLTSVMTPAASSAQEASVTGTISYRERIALPPAAVVDVTLEDVSRADPAAEVVARLRLSTPGQPPISYQLRFDANRINPRNRYAVRARIMDGDRVLFASTGTALVITQGRGLSADLILQRIGAPREMAASVPDAEPAVPTRPLAPVVELRGLPATFTGTLSCKGCPGARYELIVLPDDTFYLRSRPPGRSAAVDDDLGSWVLSSDRRAIVLRTARGGTEIFAIRDQDTLRRLDVDGGGGTDGSRDLKRSKSSLSPPDLRLTVSGIYARTPDGDRFIECSTGQSWVVSGENVVRALPSQRAPAAGNAGGTLVLAGGRLETRASGRDGSPVFSVERVEPATSEACPSRFAALPLTGTDWKLTRLGASPVRASAGTRNQPSLTFGEDTGTFSGTGGCNRLTGRYQLGADVLLMVAAGTMMACPSGGEHEAAFTKALAATRHYRILGTSLELLDGHGRPLARFEAR